LETPDPNPDLPQGRAPAAIGWEQYR